MESESESERAIDRAVEVQTSRRTAKRSWRNKASSVEISSDFSEVCGDQIVKHQLFWPDIALCWYANQERKNIHEAEDGCETLVSPNLFSDFPRRQRSKMRVNLKNVTIVQNAETGASHPCLPVHKRARQKKKRRQKHEQTNDPEVFYPSLGRERLKRRVSCENGIASQGKLDTDTFECYLGTIWRSFSDKKKDLFTYLDCLWFSLYTRESSKAKVLNWIKKKHIFSRKYVFVPIVRWCHWSLLIFCHFGGSLQSKSTTPCMLLLDSLRMANPERLEPDIRKFVWDIYKAEERPETKEQICRIPLKIPKVPQQRNGAECGNFVLYYINLFIESAPENFSIFEGYPYFMKEDWFSPEALECFCKRLQSFCQ